MRKRGKGLALALGGGAARGLAHLGVLRILEEERIGIDFVVGTSAGSLVGAVYCLNPNMEKVLQVFRSFFATNEFRNAKLHSLRRKGELDEGEGVWDSVTSYLKRGWAYTTSVTRRSILEWEEVEKYLTGVLPSTSAIDECRIPFAAVATDLNTGREKIIDKGSLFWAVAASSAIPGFFPPIIMNGQELIDGGVTSMVPVSAAFDLGARAVIAIDVSAQLTEDPHLKRSVEIIFRAHEITKNALLRSQLEQADLVLTPEVGHIHWADFESIEDYIEAGERAATKSLSVIRQLSRRSRGRFWPLMRTSKV